MSQSITIKRFLAFVVLFVFAFSITPKRFLHDLFAGHSDTCTKIYNANDSQVAKLGFKCECDNLVATSPFIEAEEQFILNAPPAFPKTWSQQLSIVFSSTPNFIELRGPPALG